MGSLYTYKKILLDKVGWWIGFVLIYFNVLEI